MGDKKYYIKNKLLIIISLMIITLMGLSSCRNKEYESGYYKYVLKHNNAYIYELTEEGGEQEVLILPNVLDGYPTGLGNYYGMLRGHEFNFESNALKQIYFNTTIVTNLYDDIAYGRIYNTGREYIVFMPYYNSDNGLKMDFDFDKYFCFSNESLKNYDCKYVGNVSYYYNYDNSDTIDWKTYYVDDVDNERIVNIPPEPIREGYRFKGWYKEKDCINIWDFEKDIVPAKKYDTEGNYLYKETIIYAGWEKVE